MSIILFPWKYAFLLEKRKAPRARQNFEGFSFPITLLVFVVDLCYRSSLSAGNASASSEATEKGTFFAVSVAVAMSEAVAWS
ncbi:MAG: hypothetical protein LRY73_01635 [Bacillus sp. (in: Bacteria)]|nr:hypothetical protein [Bacillus sp. (in: firmicutes)]